MSKYNIYLSSVKREFEAVRQQIFAGIATRSRLYDATGMEEYTAEDLPAVQKCRNDVKACRIYVCILGHMYGSIVNDGLGMSFTHHEYEEATLMKKQYPSIFERLIFVKEPFYENDDHPNLTALKKQLLSADQRLVKTFKSDDELPALILDALDNYVCSTNKITDINFDKIYLCDRVQPASEFDMFFDTSSDAVQFFLINSHEKDMPHFFIKRKELEFSEQELNTQQLYVTPVIIDNEDSFETVEYAIKAAIKTEWDKRKGWPKFKTAANVTVENGFAFMNELNIDILIIAWQIQSVHWKSDTLREHISAFYNKYAAFNKNIVTTKKIIFIGVLSYSTGSALTQEEFEAKVNNIMYGKKLTKFSLINRLDIKQWINSAGLEDNPSIQENLVEISFPDHTKESFFLSELEEPLKNIIRRCSGQQD
jgi:hypothetical protein